MYIMTDYQIIEYGIPYYLPNKAILLPNKLQPRKPKKAVFYMCFLSNSVFFCNFAFEILLLMREWLFYTTKMSVL